MAVSHEVTREILREELTLVRDVAAAQKWRLIPDYERLVLLVTMYAHTGDPYIVEITCDDYKQVPPLFEFIDPDTGERGTRHAYPRATDSFFHDSGPCICAPFNRKAYKSYIGTGPHGDWSFGNWQTSTASNVQWANFAKIGDMLGAIYARISRPDRYKGRMQ
jgi:hypothetical protein